MTYTPQGHVTFVTCRCYWVNEQAGEAASREAASPQKEAQISRGATSPAVAPCPMVFIPRTPTWKDDYREAAGLEVVLGRFEEAA